MYSPSPSIPSQSVIQKPSRPPPPIWLSSRKARSNRVYEANPPSSNWWACWALKLAAPPSNRTPITVATRMGKTPRVPGKATPKIGSSAGKRDTRSEEHTSELQSLAYLVCRLLLEKKKINKLQAITTPQHNI